MTAKDLIHIWPTLDTVSRGEAIVKCQHATNISNRAIAKLVGCSEGKVRYHKQLAALPETTKQAIKAGASAKEALAQHRQQMQSEDARHGGASRQWQRDRMVCGARAILRFAKEQQLFPVYAEQIIREAQLQSLWFLAPRPARARYWSSTPEVAFATCKPPDPMPSCIDGLNWLVFWLAAAMQSLIPHDGLRRATFDLALKWLLERGL